MVDLGCSKCHNLPCVVSLLLSTTRQLSGPWGSKKKIHHIFFRSIIVVVEFRTGLITDFIFSVNLRMSESYSSHECWYNLPHCGLPYTVDNWPKDPTGLSRLQYVSILHTHKHKEWLLIGHFVLGLWKGIVIYIFFEPIYYILFFIVVYKYKNKLERKVPFNPTVRKITVSNIEVPPNVPSAPPPPYAYW